MKRKLIYAGLGLAVLILVELFFTGHLWNGSQPHALGAGAGAQPALAPGLTRVSSTTQVAPTVTPPPPIAEVSPASAGQPSSSGTSSKGYLAGDGKTVLPMEGKEVLPPVGEGIGQAGGVNPAPGEPPVEFLNKSTPSPLLSAPNPVNVSGPLVSGEVPNPR